MPPAPSVLSGLLLQVYAFAVGGLVGSFLNVVIARVPRGESIVWPGSRCPKCLHAIRWYDNMPVVSWLVLRGRCRDCAAPISPRYPMVELVTAFLALAIARRFGWSLATPAFFAFAAMLVAIAYVDLDTWLIPYALSIPAVVLGLLFSIVNPILSHWWLSPLGAVIGAGIFWLVAWIGERVMKKEALGFGDVILLGMIGAWLGPQGLLPVVLFASVLGVIIGSVMLMLAKRAGAVQEPPPPSSSSSELEEDTWQPDPHAIPFGPFLVIGALLQLLLGDALQLMWEQTIRRIWS